MRLSLKRRITGGRKRADWKKLERNRKKS